MGDFVVGSTGVVEAGGFGVGSGVDDVGEFASGVVFVGDGGGVGIMETG